MAQRLIEKTAPAVQVERSKGARTRGRLLDIANEAIIQKGFAATSIEELVEAAGITKSGFFYHFRDKNDLARQLFERFVDEDNALLDGLTARARSLSEDPLHSLLIFLALYAETMDDLPDLHPGCLVAAITYQERMFDGEVRRMNADSILGLRARFRTWLDEIARVRTPCIPTDLDALADQLNTVVEGSIILSKALADPGLMGRQMRLFRDQVKLIFGA